MCGNDNCTGEHGPPRSPFEMVLQSPASSPNGDASARRTSASTSASTSATSAAAEVQAQAPPSPLPQDHLGVVTDNICSACGEVYRQGDEGWFGCDSLVGEDYCPNDTCPKCIKYYGLPR